MTDMGSPAAAVAITFFPDFAAATKREAQVTLHDLVQLIAATSAPVKTALPWLKMGRFGDKPTEKGSLRSNENLRVCTGIEADYDGERVAFGDAVSILKEAVVSAIVYTSPSHTEAKPRWRVLCKFSQERSPEQRNLYMARLSGLFNGIFARESWTLSQSYYYGFVDGNSSHRAQLIEGTPIDLMDALDASAIGRPEKPAANGHANERPIGSGAAYVPASDARLEGFRLSVLDNMRRQAVDGQKHHALRNAALALGGIQAEAGFTDTQAVQWLIDALPSSVEDWNHAKTTAAWGLQEGRGRPFQLEDRSRPNGAAQPHPEPPPDGPPPPEDEPQAKEPPKSEIPPPEPGNPEYPLLDAAAFMATFTNPDYLIDGIIQRGRVHALTSMTGHGKTALALYLGCSIDRGSCIGNLEVVQGEVIFLAGENPDDLCGRFFAACQHYEIDPASLRVRVMPGNFPMDAETAQALKRQIDETGRPPALIIADSAAAYFPGDDDNQNVQMGDFARNLRVLTMCTGRPAVLVLCHPVKNAGRENLIPRGGGAFLNEIDVNLTLWADAQETTTLHWQGKIRGVDFQPVNFCLRPVKIADKTDAKGRPFVSIVATLQTEEQAEKAVKQATTDENTVLEWLRRTPGISLANIAHNVGWVSDSGVPNKAKVHRLLKTLERLKLAKSWRGKWRITDTGKAELNGSQLDNDEAES